MIPHEHPTDKDFLTAHRIEALPKIDRQGIHFGFFWISWDRLVGWDGEDERARKVFWETSVFAKNLKDWIKQYQTVFGEAVLNPETESKNLEKEEKASPRKGVAIDVSRCLRGLKNIYVSGSPSKGGGNEGSRKSLIETAISEILKDGATALQREYLGYKQYAGFGDQRCDCEYGMGPRHGSIVFDIGRTREARRQAVTLGFDEVYLLECVRDFGSESLKSDRGDYDKDWNLCDIIRKVESLKHDLAFFESYLIGARVEIVIPAFTTPKKED